MGAGGGMTWLKWVDMATQTKPNKPCLIPGGAGSVPALPSSTSWSSVMMRTMLGRMFLRSLWMRPLKPWALVVMKAQLPGVNSRDSRTTQVSHRISMVPGTTRGRTGRWEEREQKRWKERGKRSGRAPHSHSCFSCSWCRLLTEKKKKYIKKV